MALNIRINENNIICIGQPHGKMQGIYTLSTNKFNNNNCIKLSKNKNCICNKCYVNRSAGVNPHLIPSLNKNEFLKNQLLNKTEIEKLSFLKNIKYFRFEAFGDISTEIQLTNYINISKKYKNCMFALWSKNYLLLLNYFKKYRVAFPKNLNLILSSPIVNKPLNKLFIETIKKYNNNNLIVFTVYDKKAAQKIEINCGSKNCIDCLNCYKKGKKSDVNELLK